MSDLRECPFCGGEAFINHNGEMAGIGCNGCDAEMWVHVMEASAAIAAWNRRAPSAAFRAGAAEMRERAAGVATSDLRSGATLCPYITDKPGDPTWHHTDADICPVCRKRGDESLGFCTAFVGGRISAAIRALPLPAAPEADHAS